jgi:hypothetical protein
MDRSDYLLVDGNIGRDPDSSIVVRMNGLGHKELEEVIRVGEPDSIGAWHVEGGAGFVFRCLGIVRREEVELKLAF